MAKSLLRTALCITCDLLRLGSSALRSHAQLAAENLLSEKALALVVFHDWIDSAGSSL